MKAKLILCLALVLSGGLFGCSTIQPIRPDAVTYSKPSSKNLQKIKIERISLTGQQLTRLISLPKDKTEFGLRWLVQEKPDTMRDETWNTLFYIFNSANTNRCVRVELLNHASYDVRHTWLNDKMLFVEVYWGRIAWTDFVLNTETLRFAYIEDGFDYTTIDQEQERESQKSKKQNAIKPKFIL
jgi:hypothetical protein